jgi:hypothetical protein
MMFRRFVASRRHAAGTLRVPSAGTTKEQPLSPPQVTARRASLLRGFTLFEVILAISLSTLLFALIAMTVNMFLRRFDARRSDVEFAQLARSIFAMISDDLRAASEYRPQDVSGAMPVGSSSASQNVNELDAPTGVINSPTTGMATASSVLTTPGVHGSLGEIIIDANRPLRPDQLFQSYTGYTNVAAQKMLPAGQTPVRQSSLRSVRYFIRQGQMIDPSNPQATSLQVDPRFPPGGLVRQDIDRAQRVAAEENGNQAVLESGQTLIAPEVVAMEIRYFDGLAVFDTWDMQLKGGLPLAVEVRLWLADPQTLNSPTAASMGQQGLLETAHEFRQTIFLPSAVPPAATSTATGTGTTSTGTGQ